MAVRFVTIGSAASGTTPGPSVTGTVSGTPPGYNSASDTLVVVRQDDKSGSITNPSGWSTTSNTNLSGPGSMSTHVGGPLPASFTLARNAPSGVLGGDGLWTLRAFTVRGVTPSVDLLAIDASTSPSGATTVSTGTTTGIAIFVAQWVGGSASVTSANGWKTELLTGSPLPLLIATLAVPTATTITLPVTSGPSNWIWHCLIARGDPRALGIYVGTAVVL